MTGGAVCTSVVVTTTVSVWSTTFVDVDAVVVVDTVNKTVVVATVAVVAVVTTTVSTALTTAVNVLVLVLEFPTSAQVSDVKRVTHTAGGVTVTTRLPKQSSKPPTTPSATAQSKSAWFCSTTVAATHLPSTGYREGKRGHRRLAPGQCSTVPQSPDSSWSIKADVQDVKLVKWQLSDVIQPKIGERW